MSNIVVAFKFLPAFANRPQVTVSSMSEFTMTNIRNVKTHIDIDEKLRLATI